MLYTKRAVSWFRALANGTRIRQGNTAIRPRVRNQGGKGKRCCQMGSLTPHRLGFPAPSRTGLFYTTSSVFDHGFLFVKQRKRGWVQSFHNGYDRLVAKRLGPWH